ncbi:hypothetical protein D917_06006, partial [Trichinella nativa]
CVCSNTNCTPFLPELSFFDNAKPITNGSHAENGSAAVSLINNNTSRDRKAKSNSSPSITKSSDFSINGTVEVAEFASSGGTSRSGIESKMSDNNNYSTSASTNVVDLNDSGTSSTGVKLFNKKGLKITSTRSDYYFTPNLDELASKMTRSGE